MTEVFAESIAVFKDVVCHVLKDTIVLLPFLFATYLALETLEAKAGGLLGRALSKTRRSGPVLGALVGAIPQCGFSAAAASLYAGGAITAGTLAAVFLSTSDELIPVLLSEKAPLALISKILFFKIAAGMIAGLAINSTLALFGRKEPHLHMDEICGHSHCGCGGNHGVFKPALVHTVQIWIFILIISFIVAFVMHFAGEDGMRNLVLNRPWAGEAIAGVIGFVPNCAVSVTGAQVYLQGGMSAGALMAMSLTGSGVGTLVLFRANRRRWKSSLALLAAVYAFGVVGGRIAGCFL